MLFHEPDVRVTPELVAEAGDDCWVGAGPLETIIVSDVVMTGADSLAVPESVDEMDGMVSFPHDEALREAAGTEVKSPAPLVVTSTDPAPDVEFAKLVKLTSDDMADWLPDATGLLEIPTPVAFEEVPPVADVLPGGASSSAVPVGAEVEFAADEASPELPRLAGLPTLPGMESPPVELVEAAEVGRSVGRPEPPGVEDPLAVELAAVGNGAVEPAAAELAVSESEVAEPDACGLVVAEWAALELAEFAAAVEFEAAEPASVELTELAAEVVEPAEVAELVVVEFEYSEPEVVEFAGVGLAESVLAESVELAESVASLVVVEFQPVVGPVAAKEESFESAVVAAALEDAEDSDTPVEDAPGTELASAVPVSDGSTEAVGSTFVEDGTG